ncbi:MAG: hypothetical protein ACKVOK_01370 [Flavobacteriales bacterium]
MATNHFDENEYLRIHRQLSEKHIRLLHSGDSNCAFMTWHEVSKKKMSMRAGSSRINPFVMMMEMPSGTFTDTGVEYVRDTVIGGFALVAVIPDNQIENLDFVHEKSAEAKHIGIDVLMRLKKLSIHSGDLPCEPLLQGFSLSSVSYELVEDVTMGLFGYLFLYPLRCATPIEYDSSRWQ